MRIKKLLIVCGIILGLAPSIFADNQIIIGAGATFPYPIYAKWAQAYQSIGNLNLNYQPIGSGGGIKQIQAQTVDFGASDMPLSNEELQKNKLVQFPTVVGGVVPVVNIPDIKPGQLKLSGSVLAQIYLGEIKKWNDEKITTLNPELKLPNIPITVVHRSDGSGTTFLFTNYLGKVNDVWKSRVGSNSAVSWPTGIGGKGNEGVASYVQRVKGGVGYVEYAYAKQNRLAHVLLQNKAGNFIAPSLDSFKMAAISAQWNNELHFAEILTDEAGAQSWPISGATFILMQKTQVDPKKAKAILAFFDWAYHHAQTMTAELDYVPLPENAITLVEEYWAAHIKDSSGNSLWP